MPTLHRPRPGGNRERAPVVSVHLGLGRGPMRRRPKSRLRAYGELLGAHQGRLCLVELSPRSCILLRLWEPEGGSSGAEISATAYALLAKCDGETTDVIAAAHQTLGPASPGEVVLGNDFHTLIDAGTSRPPCVMKRAFKSSSFGRMSGSRVGGGGGAGGAAGFDAAGSAARAPRNLASESVGILNPTHWSATFRRSNALLFKGFRFALR